SNTRETTRSAPPSAAWRKFAPHGAPLESKLKPTRAARRVALRGGSGFARRLPQGPTPMSTQHHYSTPLRFARGLFAAALLFAGGALFAQATDRYTETIEKFVAADRARPTEPGGVVFTGSSTITIWNSKLARDFPGINVIGRGFGGSTIPNHLNHAARTILPHKPSLIVFYCGENDIAGGRSPQQMAADFVSLCDLIFAELPDTRILYMGMKPSPKRWNLQPKFDEGNALVADYAARAFRVAYLDIKAPFLGADGRPRPELYANDELHLSPEGYKILKA